MALYKIPDAYKPGFELISNLTNDQIDVIVKSFKTAEIGSGPETILNLVNNKIDQKESLLRSALNAIFSLINLKNSSNINSDELINDISEAFKTEFCDGNKNKKAEILENNLKLLLSSQENLGLTIKANYLLKENQKKFQESRIISDIRIVFGDDIQKDCKNALVVHQLKLVYQENDETKEIYISLDNSDLKKLSESINRALSKEKSIIENSSNLFTFINITE